MIEPEIIGSFSDYDGLIERIRERAVDVNLSYLMIDALAEMCDGTTGKYLADIRAKQLTISSLLRITRVLAMKGIFVVDPDLLAEMQPQWETRDEKRAHARRRASIGQVTMNRLLPEVFSEFAKRGNAARNAKLTPDQRSLVAKRAARARWRKRRA